MLETMYPAAVNSKQTELAEAIDDTQTSFSVLDGSVLPPAPNLLTLGTDESAETVLYTGKTGNEITGVTRGFESGAVSWAAGTKLARFFTAYDHDTFRENITDLDQRLNNIPAPQDASLTDKGVVQLSNKTDGMSESEAATEKAVKDAYDRGSAGVTAAQAAHAIINNRDGYGSTTNSGNAYSVTLDPAPTALVAGLRATVRINVANTGAVTINVNGLGARSVLKSNGTAMTANSLRANSVYSLVYNGTNFIIQGEGGEYGTAVATDVLTGKTIGTDSGLISGSMPNQGAFDITIQSYGQSINIPYGFHNGGRVSATYLPQKKFKSTYPGSSASGFYISVNLGFAADIVLLSNSYGSYIAVVKVYNFGGTSYTWQGRGGGNYLSAPTDFNGTTFSMLVYLDGGTYTVEAWA